MSTPQNFVPAQNSRGLAAFDALKTLGTGTLLQDNRQRINMQPGDVLMFRLTRVKEITSIKPGSNPPVSHTYLGFEGELENGDPVILLESGNIANFLTEKQTGNVLAVACTGVLDTGKESPMKVFEVLDFGDVDDFPKPQSQTTRGNARAAARR